MQAGFALFDAIQKYLHDFPVQIVFQHSVFHAGVDTRIIVHFDNIAAVVDLLEVDSVQTVADAVCRL